MKSHTDRPSARTAERPSLLAKACTSTTERPSLLAKACTSTAERPSLLAKACTSTAERPSLLAKVSPSTAERPSLLAKACTGTAPKLVEVTKTIDGVSVISMARRPVNALNLELISDLEEALIDADTNGSTGVILTSSLPTVFSAGLDLLEMHKPDNIRCKRFWTGLQDLWLTLSSLRIPTAAAINGSCPAGGCMLAMICEYRCMVDGKGTIGLNETQLGAVAPKWLMTSMVDLLGPRRAETAILRGTLFPAKEALDIGLVDELAVDKAEALSKCHKFIESYAHISALARHSSKLILRGERIEWLKNNREEDLANFLKAIMLPERQENLDMYVQLLKNKSKL